MYTLEELKEKKLELEACFFGALIDRDPSEGINRKKRDKDGWRSGKSKPFEFEGKVYDIIEHPKYGNDMTIDQFEELKAQIEGMIEAIGG